MRIKERYHYILDYFQTHQPNPETELHYTNVYELLVAVILSAQCTDKRVNMVTPHLFQRFPTVEVLAQGEVDEIFHIIRSISYPNNKAKHLKNMAEKVMNDFNGEIPMTVKELTSLAGVGRKTANVVTSVYDNQSNMAVDTHVQRVSKRLGLVPEKLTTTLQIEQYLIKYIPKGLIAKAHHWIILHGRYICKARTPDCAKCGLTAACKWYSKSIQPHRTTNPQSTAPTS